MQTSVCVGIAVGKVHDVVVMLKHVGPGEMVVEADLVVVAAGMHHVSLHVANVRAAPPPAEKRGAE